jgi:hypothetical protein
MTPLMFAALDTAVATVEFLLRTGAEIGLSDERRFTAFLLQGCQKDQLLWPLRE